jgi:hypothetical protein
MACSKSLYNVFWRLLYKVRTCLFQPLSRNFKVAHGVNVICLVSSKLREVHFSYLGKNTLKNHRHHKINQLTC